MKRELIYMSETYFLEKIYLPIKTIYKEVKYEGEDFQVKEYNELPLWFIRDIKLKTLLDEEN